MCVLPPPTIYSKKTQRIHQVSSAQMFPNSRNESGLNAGYKVKGYKIKLLWGGKTSEDSDSVRVYSACSHVYLQAVFQRPDWMSWGGLWGHQSTCSFQHRLMHEQTSILPHPHGYSLPAAPTPDTTHGPPRERFKIIVLFVSHVWLTIELLTLL